MGGSVSEVTEVDVQSGGPYSTVTGNVTLPPAHHHILMVVTTQYQAKVSIMVTTQYQAKVGTMVITTQYQAKASNMEAFSLIKLWYNNILMIILCS